MKINCVMLGDKTLNEESTSLMYSLLLDETPKALKSPSTPYFNKFDNDQRSFHFLITLVIKDVTRMSDYDRLIPAECKQADVFLLLFSKDSLRSFNNIKSWRDRARAHGSAGAPIILVGIDAGGKEEKTGLCITKQMGYELSQEISATAYFECNIDTGAEIKALFNEIVHAQFDRYPHRYKAFENLYQIYVEDYRQQYLYLWIFYKVVLAKLPSPLAEAIVSYIIDKSEAKAYAHYYEDYGSSMQDLSFFNDNKFFKIRNIAVPEFKTTSGCTLL